MNEWIETSPSLSDACLACELAVCPNFRSWVRAETESKTQISLLQGLDKRWTIDDGQIADPRMNSL